MLKVSAEQQQVDQAVVDSFMADYAENRAYGEWELRYRAATERIDGLYEEFVPDAHPMARGLGSLLGGGVMAFVEMRYGPDELTPKLYGGDYETGVLATQHNAAHSWRFMRNGFRYAVLKNGQMELDEEGHPYYDNDFFARLPLIAASHDGIMGNKRRNDERQSAIFAGQLMMMIGGTLLPDQSVMAAIEATTWDEERQRQLVYKDEDFPRYRFAARVADTLTSSEVYGVYEGVNVIVENMTKQHQDRILTLEAERRGFNLVGASMEERMELIDSSPDLRLCLDGALDKQVAYFREVPLADPAVQSQFSSRLDNADFTDYLRAEYQGRTMSGPQLVRETKIYAGVA